MLQPSAWAMTIRESRPDDHRSLADLAALDSAAPITHEALVAELDGAPIAALDLDDGRAIADPTVPSGAAVDLLRVRAAQIGPRPQRRHVLAAVAGLLR
jgi:hypothetical protein